MSESKSSCARLLIANRGEIAVRIVRAAHSLGIETVLAASAADCGSLAAQESDRTVVLGAAPARESYLNAPRIMHAALSTGCSALHPGYGFLSERPELPTLCAEHGITFVGPTAEAMRQVGDKLSARALARRAGVAITKASAGGGGRGMVIARSSADLIESFETASLAARQAFGDGTLYLERFVDRARHVEVQVMGDGAGGAVHFGERDCSIQRRYQKMIEEAPAAVLPPAVRTQLHRAAVDLLASIGYRNAGTVEFLYDEESGKFYFMEVNARLQVEHPVSEMITGIDLVRLQLLLATGRGQLPAQERIHPNGHAIEARILAEDPARDFMPCPGRITRWRSPVGEGVRVDSAVTDGTLIPPNYDSMIAKLIVYGRTRDEAIDRLAHAIARFGVEGIPTNLPLLKCIVEHPDFRDNRLDTRWMERVLLPAFRAK